MVLSIMADTLGAVASLLNGSGVALKAIQEFSEDFHHAPADIASLTRSLQSLIGILDTVTHDNTRVLADNGRKHSKFFDWHWRLNPVLYRWGFKPS